MKILNERPDQHRITASQLMKPSGQLLSALPAQLLIQYRRSTAERQTPQADVVGTRQAHEFSVQPEAFMVMAEAASEHDNYAHGP